MLQSVLRAAIAAILLGFLGRPGRAECNAPANLRTAAATANGAGTLGNWFSAHGKNACAIASYRTGLSADNSSAPLHYSLGVALLADHQERAAETELRTAVELDPTLGRAYLVLGVIAHNHDNRDAALMFWQRATELDPQSIVALDWIAKTRIESGQYTAAADLLRTAPESEDLALDLLMADSRAKLLERAESSADRLLAAHPQWARLRVALATVLVQQNRFEDGLKLIDTALRDDPKSLELQVLRLRVLVLSNNLAEATTLAAQLLAEAPHDFDVLYLNGIVDREQSHYTDALPLLQEAKAKRPDHYDVRFNLGCVLAQLHRLTEAKAELTAAAAMPGAAPDVNFQLAAVERSLGDTAAAAREITIYKQRLAAQASHDELTSLSAQAAEKLRGGDASGAAAIERQILDRNPDDAVHWYDLALALDATGAYAEETAALERAVALRPDFAVALNQLGYLQAQGGFPQKAEASFRAAVASAPQYAEAEGNLGSLLSSQGRDREAELCFRSALAANPRAVDTWINLAATLAAEGQVEQARRAVEGALVVQPGNTDALKLRNLLVESPTASVAPHTAPNR